jgi:chemotaxis protein MotB
MSGQSGRSRRRKGGGHEEHENHERWLVTYADMVTLLMVLFIVMFAMSVVDGKKFAELASGLAASFGVQSISFTGKASPLDHQVNDAALPLNPGADPGLAGGAVSRTPVKEQGAAEAAVAAADRQRASNDAAAAER